LNTSLHQGQKVTLTIEKLTFGGGRGLARHEGYVIFIPDVAPEDIVEAEITLVKKRFAEAKLIKILKPSLQRTKPKCVYFGSCGGCNWQHIHYTHQLQAKQNIYVDFFRKLEKVEILPIIPSLNPYGYRNRIQLNLKSGKWGFHKRFSSDTVDVQHCDIAENTINDFIKNNFNYPDGRYEIFLQKNLDVSQRLVNSKSEAVLFSQVNTLQNKNLTDHLLAWMGELSFKNILELYSGGGNFTFKIAESFPDSKVLALEGSPHLVEEANKNNTSSNVEFKVCDLNKQIPSKLIYNMEPVDLILVDPPRVGCSETTIKTLLKMRPKSIIYISCNPSTLLRDLHLLQDGGFKTIKSQPFDMFPQTDHIESMTLVSRP
jgi:23S rRNA (uracil1939-C5)-methyltransferase